MPDPQLSEEEILAEIARRIDAGELEYEWDNSGLYQPYEAGEGLSSTDVAAFIHRPPKRREGESETAYRLRDEMAWKAVKRRAEAAGKAARRLKRDGEGYESVVPEVPGYVKNIPIVGQAAEGVESAARAAEHLVQDPGDALMSAAAKVGSVGSTIAGAFDNANLGALSGLYERITGDEGVQERMREASRDVDPAVSIGANVATAVSPSSAIGQIGRAGLGLVGRVAPKAGRLVRGTLGAGVGAGEAMAVNTGSDLVDLAAGREDESAARLAEGAELVRQGNPDAGIREMLASSLEGEDASVLMGAGGGVLAGTASGAVNRLRKQLPEVRRLEKAGGRTSVRGKVKAPPRAQSLIDEAEASGRTPQDVLDEGDRIRVEQRENLNKQVELNEAQALDDLDLEKDRLIEELSSLRSAARKRAQAQADALKRGDKQAALSRRLRTEQLRKEHSDLRRRSGEGGTEAGVRFGRRPPLTPEEKIERYLARARVNQKVKDQFDRGRRSVARDPDPELQSLIEEGKELGVGPYQAHRVREMRADAAGKPRIYDEASPASAASRPKPSPDLQALLGRMRRNKVKFGAQVGLDEAQARAEVPPRRVPAQIRREDASDQLRGLLDEADELGVAPGGALRHRRRMAQEAARRRAATRRLMQMDEDILAKAERDRVTRMLRDYEVLRSQTNSILRPIPIIGSTTWKIYNILSRMIRGGKADGVNKGLGLALRADPLMRLLSEQHRVALPAAVAAEQE